MLTIGVSAGFAPPPGFPGAPRKLCLACHNMILIDKISRRVPAAARLPASSWGPWFPTAGISRAVIHFTIG